MCIRDSTHTIQTFESDTRRSSESSGSVVDVESVADLLTPLPPPVQTQPSDSLYTTSESLPGNDIITVKDPSPPQPGKVEEEERKPDETTEPTDDDTQQENEEKTSEEQLKEREKAEGEEEEPTRPVVEVEVKEKDSQDKDGEAEDEGQVDSDKGAAGSEALPPQLENIVVLDREESDAELTKILLEALRRYKNFSIYVNVLNVNCS